MSRGYGQRQRWILEDLAIVETGQWVSILALAHGATPLDGAWTYSWNDDVDRTLLETTRRAVRKLEADGRVEARLMKAGDRGQAQLHVRLVEQ